MKLQKVNPQESGKLLYELDKVAFNRDFDIPARDIAEEVTYLKDSQVFIAYEDSTPFGFIAFFIENNTVEIKSLAVIPSYQGKGFGKLILKEIIEKVRGKKVIVVTHPKNTPGIILYLKCNFEIVGWKDDYYGDGEPRIILSLK